MAEEREGVARRLGLTRTQAVAYYQRGLQSFESGDLENAILDLNEAIYYEPNFAEYYSTRGLFHIENKDFEAAKTDLNYALKLNKRQWLAHYGFGMMHFANGEYEDAVKRFESAGAIRPERPEIWYYKAVAEHNNADDTQAAADMERAESLFPPGDKRRKDAAAWVKELKKNAAPPALSAPPGAPPLKSGERPQLKAPEKK